MVKGILFETLCNFLEERDGEKGWEIVEAISDDASGVVLDINDTGVDAAEVEDTRTASGLVCMLSLCSSA